MGREKRGVLGYLLFSGRGGRDNGHLKIVEGWGIDADCACGGEGNYTMS